MYLRSHNGWKLYGSVHPSSVGCSAQGRDICDCKYHVVSDDGIINSYDTYEEANISYLALSGAKDFELGKDSISSFTGSIIN